MKIYRSSQPRIVYAIAFIVIYFALAWAVLNRIERPVEDVPTIRVIFEEVPK